MTDPATDLDTPGAAAPAKAQQQSQDGEIDESLYSRQLYVLGHEAMKRMGASNVLVVGLNGLGVEIAKNIALAGVKSLTLYDPNPVRIADLSSQFFLHPDDVGKPRDQVTAPRVAELNNYTPVSVLESPSLVKNLAQLEQFQVVVLTKTSLKDQLFISEYCHDKGIYLVIADTFGLFGFIFTDFGKDFVVVDATGENPVSGIIADIDETGLVSALDETRHGLEDGDYVQFSEIKGMDKLNGAPARKVTVKGPYSFSIGDVSDLGQYQGGGLFTQVKTPKKIDFQPFSEQLKKPEFVISDFAKFDRAGQLHVGIQALHNFAAEHDGQLPRPHHEADAKEVVEFATKLGKESEVEIDPKLITELAYQAQGDLSPLAAFFGGLAAQEVLKAVSGKFHPIKQWLFLDSLESLPTSVKRSEELCKPTGTRYDGQIAVFGREFQEKISNVKNFLVGAGAIGCEMLKNYAMIGLATGPEGQIFVTDNDSIEKSNLNRQFLFRPKDVGKQKSECAAAAVQAMNPDLKGKITPLTDRVGSDTEHIFTEDFWKNLDIVTNALDNVEARTYVDRKCVFHHKPLLESGTLGTKGNTQVVIPRVTESYSNSQDPPEQSFPMCTLRSFPNRIEHTIAWARDLFQSYFVGPPETVNLYLTQPDYINTTLRQQGNEKQILDNLKEFLVTEKPSDFNDCIAWARTQFEKQYHNAIEQLLYNFPKDSKTSSGADFWSGPKRAPTPLRFDPKNETHLAFIIAAANLRAYNYGIKAPVLKREEYVSAISNVIIPEFKPDSKVKIQADDKEPDPNGPPPTFADDAEELNRIVKSLPAPQSLPDFRLNVVEFEKDDDTNHHIDFITAASNLRALNYDIPVADRHKTKFIAGKIIPAIATTTALVTGLVILELYKIIDGKTDIEQYKNGFINLALPFFGFSEPIASPKGKYQGKEGEVEIDKIWDSFTVDDITLTEFLKYFEDKGLSITMVSSGVSLLYASFYPASKLKDRLPLKMTKLLETISRKPIPAEAKNIIFEITAEDQSEEDVEIPYVTPSDKSGEFKRQQSQFRNWIKNESGAEFAPEKDRYHLYISYACPWAHRTMIVRKLKGLEDIIPFTSVHWLMGEQGWRFVTEDEHLPGANVTADPVNPQHTHLRDIYFSVNPDYSGRFTVPTLYDKKRKTIAAYDAAVHQLFAALDRTEQNLIKAAAAAASGGASSYYYFGDRLTEADVRLFVTIVRFDVVYVQHFKCNIRDIRSGYPYIHRWLRNLYWNHPDAFRETTQFEHIKNHYTKSHKQINPFGITPVGPVPDILGLDDEVAAVGASMAKEIQNAQSDEPRAIGVRSGGRLARKYEYVLFYLFAIASWSLEITSGCVGSLYGAQSHVFIGTIPSALMGMIIWAVAYRFRHKASSQAYWIIFLIVWIASTVVCMMNVYNNVTWESDLLQQIAPDYPQSNFWLGVLGIRSICQAKYPPPSQKDVDAEPVLQTGLIPSAAGSSYFELELAPQARKFVGQPATVKLSCAVHGPKPLPRNASFSPNLQLTASVKFAPFATSERRGYIRDATERDLGVHLENALKAMLLPTRWPKSAIDVAITTLLLDPNPTEHESVLAAGVVGVLPSPIGFDSLLDKAVVAAKAVQPVLRDALLESAKQVKKQPQAANSNGKTSAIAHNQDVEMAT
ncbi:hypothetical protein DV738_g4967, partial [Chaetothyriales sp. CBS 135597]